MHRPCIWYVYIYIYLFKYDQKITYFLIYAVLNVSIGQKGLILNTQTHPPKYSFSIVMFWLFAAWNLLIASDLVCLVGWLARPIHRVRYRRSTLDRMWYVAKVQRFKSPLRSYMHTTLHSPAPIYCGIVWEIFTMSKHRYFPPSI